jgi:chromate reductase
MGEDRFRVVGVSGSFRRGSFNTALLSAATELSPDGLVIERHDISAIPLYNDDVRLAAYPEAPEAFVEAIKSADGVLFTTPEYNRSVPGVLKNAIDWASRHPDKPFDRKPVAIMGASRGVLGTIMANHHLRQILTYLNVDMLNGPEVLVGEAPKKFNEDLQLVDEPTRAFVRKHLEQLQELIRRAQ